MFLTGHYFIFSAVQCPAFNIFKCLRVLYTPRKKETNILNEELHTGIPMRERPSSLWSPKQPKLISITRRAARASSAYPGCCHRFTCLRLSGRSSLLLSGVIPTAASRIAMYFLYLILSLSVHGPVNSAHCSARTTQLTSALLDAATRPFFPVLRVSLAGPVQSVGVGVGGAKPGRMKRGLSIPQCRY